MFINKKNLIIVSSLVILGIALFYFQYNKDDEKKPQEYKFSYIHYTDSIGSAANPFLFEPQTIFVENDTIYIVDRKNYRVLILDKDFNYIKEFGKEGKGPGEFELAAYVIKKFNLLFISDPQKQQISVFNNDGEFIKGIPCNLMTISNFAVTNDTTILVCNMFGKFLINEYDLNGEIISKFGIPFTSTKELSPIKQFAFVAVDEKDNIYLSFYEFPIIHKYVDRKLEWETRYDSEEEIIKRRSEIEELDKASPQVGLYSLIVYQLLDEKKLYHIVATAEQKGSLILVFNTEDGSLISRIKNNGREFIPFSLAKENNHFYFTDWTNSKIVKAALSD